MTAGKEQVGCIVYCGCPNKSTEVFEVLLVGDDCPLIASGKKGINEGAGWIFMGCKIEGGLISLYYIKLINIINLSYFRFLILHKNNTFLSRGSKVKNYKRQG